MTRLVKEVNGLNPSFDGAASIQGFSIIIIHPYAHQQSCLQYKWLLNFNSILTSNSNTSCYTVFKIINVLPRIHARWLGLR